MNRFFSLDLLDLRFQFCQKSQLASGILSSKVQRPQETMTYTQIYDNEITLFLFHAHAYVLDTNSQKIE